MSVTLAVALPVLPTRAVLALLQERDRGATGQIVELDPHVARQIAADLVQAADLAEARKLRGRATRLAIVSDVQSQQEST
jgi:hypothetical protein